MGRKTVLLVFGGESSEHDVSIMSARNVYAAMDNTKYHVILCYIDRHGKWWRLNSWQDNPQQSHGGVQLLAALGSKSFVTLPGNDIVPVDVIFPVLHGKNGEDGTIQGAAQLMGVPCVGPSLLAAAVTMDKSVTKRLLRDAGISVVPWQEWRKGMEKPDYHDVVSKLGHSLFIKPANAGSSVGVTHVENESDFATALDVAAQHDSLVLIEKAIEAREIEIAVLGNSKIEVSKFVGEIVSTDDFYTYDTKYSNDSEARVIIPANLNNDMLHTIHQLAEKAYTATACYGMARVDFFIVAGTNEVYVNEINSIPGFTNISMYPKLWHEQGMKYPQLIDKLINLALE